MKNVDIVRIETVEMYRYVQVLSENHPQDSCETGVTSPVSPHPGLCCTRSIPPEELCQGAHCLYSYCQERKSEVV